MITRRAALGAASALAFGPRARAAETSTLLYGRGADSLSLDPAEARSSEDFKVTDYMFDGLVRFTGKGSEVGPALAESWERSEDGLSWTFRLRKNVKFHDGTDFTSEAVILSFARQFDKTHKLYSSRFFRWAGKLAEMNRAEAVDDHTVRLHFSAPAPALLVNLAIYIGYIASPKALQGDPQGFRQHPVGTGPFRFVRWEKDNLIEMAANDLYWQGRPKLDRLIFRTIPDNDVRLLALQKGEIQLTDDVPFNRWATLERDPHLALHTTPAYGFSSLFFNCRKGPFTDIRLRRAVQHALNRERIYKTVFFSRGGIADQPLPPGFSGHADTVMRYDYNPDKAKALLTEAGHPGGLQISLVAFNNPRPFFPSPRDAVALVKSDLARAGVNAQVELQSWPTYLERAHQGDFDMCLFGWTASTVDPDGVLYPVYDGKFAEDANADNTTRWSDPEADRLMQEARSTYDEAKRTADYQRASQIIAEGASTVFLAHPVYGMGASKRVQGVYRNVANQVPLHAVSLAG